MITSGPRTAIVLTVLSTLLVPATVSAQRAERQEQQQQPPTTPPLDSGQKVAAAEDVTKPTRSFFPTLFHNLGDDIKHIPRKNSLYWLGAGALGSLVIHPADDYVNNRLSSSD